MCFICQKTITVLKRANLQHHHEQLHPEFKAAYPSDGNLRRKKLQALLDGFQAKQSTFRNMVKSNDNETEASFKIAWNIAKEKTCYRGRASYLTRHLNSLDLKLQGKQMILPTMTNDVVVFQSNRTCFRSTLR